MVTKGISHQMAKRKAPSKVKLTEKTVAKLALPENKSQAHFWDDKVAGFGVVVGKKKRSFVWKSRVDGKQVQVVIAYHGEPLPDDHSCPPGSACDRAGCVWTVRAARDKANALHAAAAIGIDPKAKQRAKSGSITLRKGLEIHITKRRNANGRPSAINTIESEVTKYLEGWLDEPLIQRTRAECRARHSEIMTNNGPYLADRVMRHLRAVFNSAHTAAEDSDPLRQRSSPTESIAWCARKGGVVRKRRAEPISWEDFPDWYERTTEVQTPGSFCLQIIMLTGLRKMDAATVRWEHINFDAETLRRPNPKGGAAKAFDVPLSWQAIEVLKECKLSNEEIFGDDNGWCFPTFAEKSDAAKKDIHRCTLCPELGQPAHVAGVITHLSEPRVQVYIGEKGTKVKARDKVSPHRLRDTFIAACAEVGGLSVYDIKALINHAQPSGDVTAEYLKLSLEHLAECQQTVSDFLLEKAGQ